MILDLIDYFFGMIKMIGYCFIFSFKVRLSLFGKYSLTCHIRIWDGGKLYIGQNCSIRSGVRIRINNGVIRIGNNVGINNDCKINCMQAISIGDNVIIGQNVCMYDHDHIFGKDIIVREAGFDNESITIGNNVWIGSNCIILKGVNIGDNCVIGAGTIVNKDIASGTIAYNKKVMMKNTMEKSYDT